jgi:hypothetical protein
MPLALRNRNERRCSHWKTERARVHGREDGLGVEELWEVREFVIHVSLIAVDHVQGRNEIGGTGNVSSERARMVGSVRSRKLPLAFNVFLACGLLIKLNFEVDRGV